MSNGPLLQLTTGSRGISPLFAAQIETLHITSNIKTNISRRDSFEIKTIIVKNEDIPKISSLQIMTNEPFYEIDFGLLIKKNSKKTKNMTYIDFTFPELVLTSLNYVDIFINIIASSSVIIDVMIVTKYYNTEARYKLAGQCIPIFNYETILFQDNTQILNNNFAVGFFIESTKINSIKLVAKDNNLFDYDHRTIKVIGSVKKEKGWTQKHHNALYDSLCLPNELIDIIEKKVDAKATYFYWIPVVPYKHWTDVKIDSYLNLSRLNAKVIFDKEYKGKIHIMTWNILMIDSGFIGIKYK